MTLRLEIIRQEAPQFVAGLTLMSSVISFTSEGRHARQACGSRMRQNEIAFVIPNARAASSCPRGKSRIAARQISALKAAVLSVSARTAAGSGSRASPNAGKPK